MIRVDTIGMRASVVLGMGLLVGFLAAAGCNDSAPADKSDDPALKASMQKSMEIYKSKAPLKKGYPGATLKRQS